MRWFKKNVKYLTCKPDTLMVQLTDGEVALLKSLLVALRSIKIRDIDKALVILARANYARKP